MTFIIFHYLHCDDLFNYLFNTIGCIGERVALGCGYNDLTR